MGPNGAVLTGEGPQGLKHLDDFAILETAGLTHGHPLPAWAPRSSLGRRDIDGEVWAWFNPASIVWRGQRWLAYRTECSPLWHWSRISLAQLDETFRVIPGSNRLLELPTDYGGWGAEDPRLMVCEDRLLLSYSDGVHTGIGELNADSSLARCSVIGEKPFDLNLALEKDSREKNWGFFTHGGDIFVSSWVAPHVVFAYDERRRKLGRRWVTRWTPPISMGTLHGSSSPVSHDGLLWRVVHSFSSENARTRRYRLWLMAFAETPPFEPKWFCTKPHVIAEAEKSPGPEQVLHDVVFCGSIERTSRGWRLFFGENDRRMRQGLVEDALISPHLVNVADNVTVNGARLAISKKSKKPTKLPSNIGSCDVVVISLRTCLDRRDPSPGCLGVTWIGAI